jgi:hypothetical protein
VWPRDGGRTPSAALDAPTLLVRRRPMQKLRLNLDALVVDSFQTHAPTRAGGTVRAQSGEVSDASLCYTYAATCPNYCDPNYTLTCDGGTQCTKPSMYNNDCTI